MYHQRQTWFAIDNALKEHYGFSTLFLQNSFYIATDCAAVMTKMTGSLISKNRNTLEHRWIRCHVHTPNYALKATFHQFKNDPELHRVCSDFKNLKRIMEDDQRPEWNNCLPPGFKLVQDVQKRFSSTFLVVERFFKSASKAWVVLMKQKHDGSLNAYWSLERSKNDSESEICFRALQAISDVYEQFYQTTVHLDDSKYPSIQLALLSLYNCVRNLESHVQNVEFLQDSCNSDAYSSSFSKEIAKILVKCLEEKIEAHNLWIVGCCVHPFLREIEFVSCLSIRIDYRARAESMT